MTLYHLRFEEEYFVESLILKKSFFVAGLRLHNNFPRIVKISPTIKIIKSTHKYIPFVK